jgi:hypothetical protein
MDAPISTETAITSPERRRPRPLAQRILERRQGTSCGYIWDSESGCGSWPAPAFSRRPPVPTSFEINPALRLIESQTNGALTEADLTEHAQALKADPRFQPDFRQVWDMRLVTRFDVSREFVQLAASRSIFAPHARRAFITPSDEGFGLLRMFEAISEYFGRDQVEIFRDRESALRWLDLPPRQPAASGVPFAPTTTDGKVGGASG